MTRAVQKHGTKNFVRKVLEVCSDKDTLNVAEKKWIRRFNATRDERFYNLAEGGMSTSNLTSKPVFQYSLSGEFIQELPSVEAAALECDCATSQMTLTCKSKTRTAGGFIWSFDKVDRLPPRKVGVTLGVCKYSVDGSYLERYSSVTQAARSIGQTSTSNVIACCKGTKKSAGGFLWRYADDAPEHVEPLRRRSTATPVACHDVVTGKLVRVYVSIAEASQATGACSANIHRSMHSNFFAGGFIWRKP